jgi:broad specificity phosphatase PhoE
MDAFGKPDDSSLTQAGYARASALADLFAPAQSWPRPGVVVPRAIYAAGANSDGEGLRTRQTVAPLAQRLGLPVNTDFGKGDEQKLVARIVTEPGPTLICWQQARSRRSCRRSSRSPRCRRRCGRTRATT